MVSEKIFAIILFVIGGMSIFYVYYLEYVSESNPFKLGLDLAGGSRLTYIADTSNLQSNEINESLTSLKNVIERRVNILGVSEPVVKTSISGIITGEQTEKLIVELPGVTDIDEAIDRIGRTPLLEFHLIKALETAFIAEGGSNITVEDTGLSGRQLKKASIHYQTGPTGVPTGEVAVLTAFNKEGAEIFEKITEENVGNYIAIFLDGNLISQPRINEVIPNGEAIISGGFTADEAKTLVQDLNLGALPLPINLEGVETIDATLGQGTIQSAIYGAIVGFIVIALFLITIYRVSGLISVISLAIYIAFMLLLFKFIPITLTAAGLAGFVISIGIAVDANILIFERIGEEMKSGLYPRDAIKNGISRAWNSIRDGNFTSIIISVILYWLGTSIIKGFALTFILGVVVSMITALLFTRVFLKAFAGLSKEKFIKFLCR